MKEYVRRQSPYDVSHVLMITRHTEEGIEYDIWCSACDERLVSTSIEDRLAFLEEHRGCSALLDFLSKLKENPP